MKIEVTMHGQLIPGPAFIGDRDAAIDRALDSVMEELLRLPSVEDPGISGSLATGDVEVNVTVIADGLDEAVSLANSAIRSAFHAADVVTDGWDDVPEHLRMQWHKVEADDLIDA